VRGKRWLLLTRWHHLAPEKQQTLTALFAMNRRLAKRTCVGSSWSNSGPTPTRAPARRFLTTWLLALRWQRLPAFEKLGNLLLTHLDGILAYCHEKVPFGVVEAINGKHPGRSAPGRGYRDHQYLLLKVQQYTVEGRRLKAA